MTFYIQRFEKYFSEIPAQNAARSLSDGIEIEIKIENEVFTFTRENGENRVKNRASHNPEIRFILTPLGANQILDDKTDEIGEIGINIMRLVAKKEISFRFECGFFLLLKKGYFGVLKSGGSSFASFLASKGLGGVSSIKAALKKQRG